MQQHQSRGLLRLEIGHLVPKLLFDFLFERVHESALEIAVEHFGGGCSIAADGGRISKPRATASIARRTFAFVAPASSTSANSLSAIAASTVPAQVRKSFAEVGAGYLAQVVVDCRLM